jgi:hypothetical protein
VQRRRDCLQLVFFPGYQVPVNLQGHIDRTVPYLFFHAPTFVMDGLSKKAVPLCLPRQIEVRDNGTREKIVVNEEKGVSL